MSESEEKPKSKKVELCGHVNRHHYGPDGKLEPITCDLPSGHSGDHHARFMKNIHERVHDEKGRIVKTILHQEEGEGNWGDAAGVPADQAVVGDSIQLSLLQKDLVLQILNKNPRLGLQQALSQAKALPQWNAAELL